MAWHAAQPIFPYSFAASTANDGAPEVFAASCFGASICHGSTSVASNSEDWRMRSADAAA
jgi:hypothetical protein